MKNKCGIQNAKREVAHTSGAVAHKCSVKKVFLNISQNSQENICAGVFFNKIASLSPQACNFIKNRDSGTGVFL